MRTSVLAWLRAIALFAVAISVHAAQTYVSVFFDQPSIGAGGTAGFYIQLRENDGTAFTNGAITVTYPAGMVNDGTYGDPIFNDDCTSGHGATVTRTAGTNQLIVTNVSLGAFQFCDIAVRVTASAFGSYTITIPPGSFSSSTPPTTNSATTSTTLNVTGPVFVTNTADSGVGSLRDAINTLNGNCGSANGINFNIPGAGPHVIGPLSELPGITCAGAAIDGYTQSGATVNSMPFNGGNNASIQVVLNGASCGICEGLQLLTYGISVSGLAIHSFNGQGITSYAGTSTNYILGNYIGTDPGGMSALGNAGHGVYAAGGYTYIGDGTPSGANLITANSGVGVNAGGSGGSIRAEMNQVGGRRDGNPGLGNGIAGIYLNGANFQRNFVSYNRVLGNGGPGIDVTGATSADVVIYGNGSAGNTGIGIDIGDNGANANDEASFPYDGDGVQNYPVITSVVQSGGNTTVSGYLKSIASRTGVTIYLYHNNSATAVPEGEVLIDAFSAPTDATGVATFSRPIGGTWNNVSANVVMDTCNDACYRSSEYSPKVAATSGVKAPTISAIRPTTTSSAGGGAIEIEGADLGTSPSVTIGGIPVPIINNFGTSLTVLAPTYTPGSVAVVVTTPGGSVTAGTSLTFVGSDDAARDFSAGVNPSPRWTYGSEPSRGGTFTPYGAYLRASAATLDEWSHGGLPVVARNSTGGTVNSAGTNPMPSGTLALHPGGSGANSVVRWTAPAAGAYHVAGAFTGRDNVYPTTTDVAVLKNNSAATPLFADTVLDYGVPHAFAFDVVMASGDTLEFIVGDGGNGISGDLTGLDAVITSVATAPALTLSTSSLTFGPQLNGTVAPPQTVTLTNTGTGTLTFSSIGTGSANYPNTPTCTTFLAPGASCDVAVTFMSPTTGIFPGTLTITSDAPGSPHTVSLSGKSAAPPTFAIATFTSRTPGQVSTVTVNIGNTSGNPVTYSGFSVQLDYPPGFVHDTSRPVQTSCAASVFTVGSPTVTGIGASGGSVSPGVACGVVSSQLFAPTTPGTYTFTIPAGGFTITSPFAYSNPSPITATVNVSVVPAPGVSLSPSPLTFASQTIGTSSASQAVTLTNTGNAALNVSSISTTGDFSQTNACPASLAASATCTINVTFSPTVAGPRGGTLSVTSNASGSPHTVPLSGTGVAPAPIVSLTPGSLTFPSRTVSTTSPAQTVTLANTGNAPLAIASITISGDFAFTSGCGVSLAAGGSCTIDVTFTPLVAGARSGSLTLSDNASGSPHAVPLSGTGLSSAAAVLNVSPGVVDFPAQPVGSDSAPDIVTVSNAGNAPLTFTAISITGEFALGTPAGTSPPACPVTLAPGASCRIAVIFRPTAPNLRQGVLTIATNGGSVALNVMGTGLVPEPPQLTIPASLDFGSQPVGIPSVGRPLAMRNISPYVASITELTATGDFSVSDTCTTIAVGATCSPLVTFTPTLLGPRTGTLTVRTLRDANPYRVALTGTGAENRLPALELSPVRLGYGNAFVGQLVTHEVTLRNVGLAPLTVSSIVTTGDFFSDGACLGPLAPTAACTVRITFAASAPGGRNGVMRIVSDAPGSPHDVSLSGTGCFLPTPSRVRFGVLLCGS